MRSGWAGLLAAVVMVLGLAIPASAHDLWWAREDGGFVLRYGHLPGTHEGARIMDYDAGTVARVWGLPAEGPAVEITLANGAETVRVEGVWTAVAAEMAPVLWTKTPYGTKRAARSEVDMPLESWESREGTKRIERWRPELAGPLGGGLEILPLADPTALRPGDKLRVRVVLNGEPAAGAAVAYDGRPRGTTGEDGEVNLKLRRPGVQIIQASWESALDGGRADKVVHAAALTFDVEEGT